MIGGALAPKDFIDKQRKNVRKETLLCNKAIYLVNHNKKEILGVCEDSRNERFNKENGV